MVTNEIERLIDKGYSPGMSFLKPIAINIHDDIAYETYRVPRDPIKLHELRLRAHRFEGYVGYDVLDASDQIRRNVQPGKRGRQVEAKFVRTIGVNAKDVGVVIQAIVDVSVGGQKKRGLDIGVKAIDPGFRNRDIGTYLLIYALLEHEGINFVTGQSRNGRVFAYLEKVRDLGLIGKIRGYEEPLTDKDLDVLEQTLSKTKFNKVNQLRTGLCLGIYPEADSKLFLAPEKDENAKRIVDNLEKLGVKPGGRNGIRYFADVNQEAVEALKPVCIEGDEAVYQKFMEAASKGEAELIAPVKLIAQKFINTFLRSRR